MPLTITTIPVTNIIGRTANHFGVGEVVDLHGTIVPVPMMTPAWRWEVTLGSDLGNFSVNGAHARVIFLSLTGGTMTIRARNALDNAEAIINLTIEAPAKWSLGPIQYRFHQPNYAHAAFRAAVQVENLHNVSFDNIEMREGNAIPKCVGRYILDHINLNNHHQATFGLHADWINLGTCRHDAPLQVAASPQHLAIAIDRVGSYAFGPRFPLPNWPNGSFTWDIPWTYRLSIPNAQRHDVHGNLIQFPAQEFRHVGAVISHQEILVGNKMTMRKGGQSYTCYANDPAVGNYALWNA